MGFWAKTRMKDGVKLAWYLILFAIGVIFIGDVILEYLEGKTWFTSMVQPLTRSDLPTVTICFERPAKDQVSVQNDLDIALYRENTNITLLPGENHMNSNSSIVLTELKVLQETFGVWMRRYCFKISHRR